MQRKSNTLFDIDKLVQRPIPEQRAFELDYYDFLTILPGKIDLAFEMTRREMQNKPPLSINRVWFANTMNGNVIYQIGTSFPEYLRNTGRGSYYLRFNHMYEGYLKKLSGKKLFPSYNHSRTSRALTEQKAYSEQEAIPVVYIGYSLNETNELITGYYAVCIKGKERIWRTDLKSIEPPMSMPFEAQPDLPKAPLVTPKARAQKKAG